MITIRSVCRIIEPLNTLQNLIAMTKHFSLLVFVAVVASLIFTSNSSAQDNNEAMRFFGEARKAEKEQNWNKAENLYGKAIAADPGNALYYYSRGTLNLLLGRDRRAITDINEAVKLEPGNPKMHLLKAQYFNYNKLPDSALVYIQNAEALEMTAKQVAEAQIARGDAFRLLRDFQRSSENYEKALAVDTANAEALENMALVLYELGDKKQAAHYLQILLALNPYIMDTYINVGYIYARIGMFLESLSYSDEALKYDPQQPIALANKAYALFKLEDYDEALKTVNRSIKNMPANPFALKVRALITIATEGRINRACSDLKKSLKYGYNELYDDGEVDALIETHCK